MGFRFRRSIKSAPGLKLNKKSISLTGGGTSSSENNQSNGTSPPNDSSGNGHLGGCMLPILKVVGCILLFPLLLAFGWIAGAIWFIFFRKKMNKTPDRQKKYTVGFSILSIISFIIFLNAVVYDPPVPTSLTLSPDFEEQILDIDSNYIINVQYEPENATLSAVTYQIDNSLLAAITPESDNPSTLNLHTDGEGTIQVTAEYEGYKSNTLTFNIIDKERIAKEKEAEEARVQREKEEEARIQEEKAAEEARIQKEREAEEARIQREKKAEEARIQKEKETEEARIQEERKASEQQSSSNQSLSNAISSNTASDIAASSEVTEPEPPSIEGTVWLSATGEKYHRINNCGRMNPNKARQVSLQDAIDGGYGPCSKCY